ncbi:MAG: NADH-quinone oxidoreductase subunit J [Spirochaetota bacterium]
MDAVRAIIGSISVDQFNRMFVDGAFMFFAVIVASAAIAAIFLKNPITSAASLVLSLFALAVLYFIADMQFVGIVQILVYAAGIIVLFLFVLMYIDLAAQGNMHIPSRTKRLFGALIAVVLLANLFFALISILHAPSMVAETTKHFTVTDFARLLFVENNAFTVAFELIGIHLFIGMVFVIYFTQKKTADR